MPLPPTATLADDGWLSPHLPAIRARTQRVQALKDQLRGKGSLADFAQGHLHYGLHQQVDGSWIYRDWAPHATALHLIGPFSDWLEKPEYAAQRVNERGDWELRLPAQALHHGQLYRLHLRWPGGSGDRLPAWGDRVVQDAESLAFHAEVWAPSQPYLWKHERPGNARPLFIYEAHAGMAQVEPRVGTWEEFRLKVLPRIHAGGYTAVQLMAVQEHPYYGSFGYHVSSFFAASSRFGTPEELKALIDDAHGLGLRVIMDLVHSHAVKNELEGISRYDGSLHQFFHSGARGEHTAWDSRCFDYAKPAVLHFLLSNLRYWLEEFRFDGFRFDGVTSMLYHDHGISSSFGSYSDYFGDRVDEDAVAYLTLATEMMHELVPESLAIAEDVSGMAGLGARAAEGGIGFDYRLAMGVPDTWFKLTDLQDEDWSMNWLWHELTNRRADERVISYVESHDQALVGGKSFIFTLIDADMYWHMHVGSQSLTVERGIALHKLARMATVGTAAHGYMNFMGNEFGHPEWVDFPREGNGWSYEKARRQWQLRDDAALRFKHLADFDQALLNLLPVGWDHSWAEAVKVDDGDKLLAWRRGPYLFLLNFHPSQSFTDYGLQLGTCRYELLLSSDEPRFGGFDRVQHDAPVSADSAGWLKFYLPSRVGLLYRAVL